MHPDEGALSRLTFDFQVTLMELCDALNDGEAKACATGGPAAGPILPNKSFPKRGKKVHGDAFSLVLYF